MKRRHMTDREALALLRGEISEVRQTNAKLKQCLRELADWNEFFTRNYPMSHSGRQVNEEKVAIARRLADD